MLRGPGRASHRIAFAVATGLLLVGPLRARAELPASISIATGQYGFRKEVPHGLGIELQVRPSWEWNSIRPTVGVLTNSNGGAYVFAGFVVEVPLPLGLQLSPGFAPGVMMANDNSGHLGFPLEFRSSIEVSLERHDGTRVGVSFMHISNGRMADHNPGVEALMLSLTFPGPRLESRTAYHPSRGR